MRLKFNKELATERNKWGSVIAMDVKLLYGVFTFKSVDGTTKVLSALDLDQGERIQDLAYLAENLCRYSKLVGGHC